MRASTPLKLITATALTSLIAISAIAHDKDGPRENLTTHDLSGFSKIEVSGIYGLDVKVGEAFSVTTSGSDKEIEYMEISVKGDTLILGTKERKKSWNMGNRKEVLAEITLPKLTEMEVAGIATGEVVGIDADDFEMDVAGISNLELSGKCRKFELNLAGMGDVEAENLKCEHVEVDIAGMGEASVYASTSVDANAAGMGQIEVYGSPKNVRKNKNFMSKVTIK